MKRRVASKAEVRPRTLRTALQPLLIPEVPIGGDREREHVGEGPPSAGKRADEQRLGGVEEQNEHEPTDDGVHRRILGTAAATKRVPACEPKRDPVIDSTPQCKWSCARGDGR